MGIPHFFRIICERYPCIIEKLKESEEPDIDNFYIDVNSIIHLCSYSNDVTINYTEQEIFKNTFNFFDVLFNFIRPKKIFFLAVDGVPPKAKLIHQRQRRFKSARKREIEEKLLSEKGKLPDAQRFDINNITPGTEFMRGFQSQLEYYITQRISCNSMWQNCKVILSGHEVPGEGEHKILDYMRYLKTLPDYDPCTKHCFYGLDADLIILGLIADEHNVVILRNILEPGNQNVMKPNELKFMFLHLSLLREYLDLEFQELKTALPFGYNLDNIIDDWILMGFLLGNDFIPNIPQLHLNDEVLSVLHKTYRETLPKLGGYMNEKGHLNLPRLQAFVERLAEYELKFYKKFYTDFSRTEEKRICKLNLVENKYELIREEFKLKAYEIWKSIDYIDNGLIDIEDYEYKEDGKYENSFINFLWEIKRYHYENKLNYLNITEDVLKSVTECYVRNLQWTLHYYYHGCKSWTWFYPHHYAPYISDISRNFKDFNLEFELGKPFLPFESLLAIMPPQSKDLLPKAYHHLMTSPDSPIIDYYPESFEIDSYNIRFEWEAVPLIPAVDEKRLLKAMEKYNDKLTPEEKNCNKFGPILLYSYTDKNLGLYIAPKYGTDISSNHASVETVWQKDIAVDVSKIKRLIKDNLNPDVYFSGFPTFKFFELEAKRKKGLINAFFPRSGVESIYVTIKREEKFLTEKLVAELLGKIVYVDWPFLKEARVIGLTEHCVKYLITDKGSEKYELSRQERWKLYDCACSVRRQYLEKKGIDIGNTEIIVSANLLQGIQYNFDSSNKLICNKVWSETTENFPLQTLIKDVKVHKSFPVNCLKMKGPFPVGSIVFMLACPYYGCMGRIEKASDKSKNDRIPITLEVPLEHKIDRKLLNQSTTHYYPAYVVGIKIGISPGLVGKITEKISVNLGVPGELINEKLFANIGLALKNSKMNLELPEYTKKGSAWRYSDKAIAVMKEYVERYPHVIEYLSRQSTEKIFFAAKIFPGPNGIEETMDMIEWINNLEYRNHDLVPCGSKLVEMDIIKELEKIIDKFPKKICLKKLFVKPQLLFKSEFKSKGLAPVPTAEHQLLDRVIFVKPDHIVPLGLRGFIIGIYQGGSTDDCMYEILCDEPFTCSFGRRYKTPNMLFINISSGERNFQLRKQSKMNQLDFSRFTNPPVLTGKERSPSPFAQWSNHISTQLSPNKGDQFKTLWSYLEKVNSQDETKEIKKLMKIADDDDDDDKSKEMEDNVKLFFKSVSESAKRMMSDSPRDEILQKPQTCQRSNQPEQSFSFQLFSYFQSRKLPQPNYQVKELGNKIIYQVSLPDGKIYTGCPSKSDDWARDSAALQALIALTEIQPNDNYLKEDWQTRNIQEDQIKLEKLDLVKSGKTDSSMSPIKSKFPNDKCQQQNQSKNFIPHILPTPPLQWCRQYKNLSNSYEDQMRNSTFNVNDDHNWGSEFVSLTENDSSKVGKIQNTNLNHNSTRVDSRTNARNGNRRHEEKTRNHNGEFQCIHKCPGNGNWPSKRDQGQNNSCHDRNWPFDVNIPKQGCTPFQDRTVSENNQADNLQTPFLAAPRFIPLQASSENRNRKKSKQIQNEFWRTEKETVKEKVPDVASVNLPIRPDEDKKLIPTRKVQRKSKIAAKFDVNCD